MSQLPLKVFISYSHKDEDLKDELAVHLASLTRDGSIQPWQDRDIEAGAEWDAAIRAELEAAHVILLLITPRFLASRYCYDEEMQRALQRHETGSARVIPVIMKPSDWQSSPFSKLQVLPKDGKPVTRWDDQDEALLNVVTGIRRVIKSLNQGAFAPETATVATPSASVRDPSVSSQPMITEPATAVDPFRQRLALIQLLSSLPAPQFEQVVFALNPPAGNVPPASASLGQRVPALLQWAESPIGCGLSTLETVVSSVMHS